MGVYDTTAAAPVKKQLIFRQGGLGFLVLKRAFFSKKNVSGFEGTLRRVQGTLDFLF